MSGVRAIDVTLAIIILLFYIAFVLFTEIPEVIILYKTKVSRNVKLTYIVKFFTITGFIACYFLIRHFLLGNYREWRWISRAYPKLHLTIRFACRLLIVPLIESLIYRFAYKGPAKRTFLITYLANLTSAGWVIFLVLFDEW